MKKHTILLLIMLFLVAIFYLPLVNGYFQQDEWQAFGSYYGMTNRSLMSLFATSFTPNIGHYIPLYMLSFYGLVKLVGTNFAVWQLISILWHLATTYLVYLLLKRLFKDERLSILGSVFFGFSGTTHQATSWVIADTNTHGATLFGLLSLYFAVIAAEKETQTRKYLLFSVAAFAISLLFKETTVALFVCSPLLYFTVKKVSISKAVKSLSLPWGIVGIGYIALRAIMFILPQAKNTASVATQSQTVLEIIINMITFPAKALVESVIPSKWMLRFSESILGRIHLTGGNDVHTTGFVEFVSNMLGTAFVLIFVVALIFAVVTVVRRFKDDNARLMLYSIIFVSLNSFIFALSPERRGIITFLDSRNLYFLLVGSIVFLLAMSRYFSLHINKQKIFYSLVVFLLLLNVSAAFVDFKELVQMGETRAQILTQISKHIPVVSPKQIILVQSDTSYYGLPQDKTTPPFQSGFGQTLLVALSEKGNFPTAFYNQSFLWGITSQGYEEHDGRGFGYYRNYDDLLVAVKEHNISPQEVVSFGWKGKTEALTNQTEAVRLKLISDLK
jgi:hypothetical protein